MAPIKSIMANVMRMRKLPMLITSVRVKGNSMGPIKIHNGEIKRMRKILKLITSSVRVNIQLNL